MGEKVYYEINGRDFYSGTYGSVELDPEIAEAVEILNAKGYSTIASCAGHSPDHAGLNGIPWHGYIYFHKKPIAQLPNGIRHCKYGSKDTIRWVARTPQGLKKRHQDLLKWVKSL